MKYKKKTLMLNKIRPKKFMGQHFLKNDKISKKILEQAKISYEDTVLEIGSGLGALTLPASKLANKLLAVEKDYELVERLKNKLIILGINNVNLITSDIMDVNLKEIYKIENRKLILLGNLPYNISSQILVKTVQNKNIFSKVVFMLQKEVADRICSMPGSKSYGRLSVLFQYHANVRNILEVDPSMFFPKPKIKSSVLEIIFPSNPKLIAKNETLLFLIVKASFSKRRKTLKNSLSKGCLGLNTKKCEIALKESNIDPARRAETVSVEEFVLLSNYFHDNKIDFIL